MTHMTNFYKLDKTNFWKSQKFKLKCGFVA